MRRALLPLAALALCGAMPPASYPPASYPVVRPGIALRFPADHGAHPAFRTEWWYVTGLLRTANGRDVGFQITFFRTRPQTDAANPSRFAAGQVLFAHAALSDPAIGRLLHAERAARAGFGLAAARIGDTDVRLRDWRMRRLADGRFVATVSSAEFALSLTLNPRQPPLPQGEGGYSRKGPDPRQASYYYSIPHLAVAGTLTRNGRAVPVFGRAWLDREWSSDYLGGAAVGWDWTGLNLNDGGALMAFRIRDKAGRALWAGGSYRGRDGRVVRLTPGDVRFTPLTRWRSRRTGAVYPVAQMLSVRLPGGVRHYRLTPLFADQELDGRRSGMPVYWEGAVRTDGGSGYLELTGYAAPLSL
ncbi:lipocalin-like domain-containing protein [Sphingomonas profundi]|uniref:lipocalin-like domain-containing protein n=1 Tax=Alterirhizorhabdus profundi TaxID=2681549 RepID=UPI0012E90047|nr:carotenoid 1,2-hydratase [Sphingomonas profundi]